MSRAKNTQLFSPPTSDFQKQVGGSQDMILVVPSVHVPGSRGAIRVENGKGRSGDGQQRPVRTRVYDAPETSHKTE